MKTQSNIFFISVMILALITSPISFSGFAFASQHEESDESYEIDLIESVGISESIESEEVEDTEEEEVEDTDEEEVTTRINQATISNLGQEVSNFVYESRDYFEKQKVETKDVIAK